MTGPPEVRAAALVEAEEQDAHYAISVAAGASRDMDSLFRAARDAFDGVGGRNRGPQAEVVAALRRAAGEP
jgi:hypothetical protein